MARPRQLTDLVSDTPQLLIQFDPTVDARVRNGIAAWLDPAPTNIEWVLGLPGFPGAPNNFPAQQNLLDAYAAADASLDSLFSPGILLLGTLITGQRNYFMDILPGGCPGGDPSCQAEFFGRFNFFEQNDVDGRRLRPGPEPASILLMASGLARARRLEEKVRKIEKSFTSKSVSQWKTRAGKVLELGS